MSEKNKTIVIRGRYDWGIQVSVPEDKVGELENTFGQGTFHNQQVHDYDDGTTNTDGICFMVENLGGSTISQNYEYGVEIEEFEIEEND